MSELENFFNKELNEYISELENPDSNHQVASLTESMMYSFLSVLGDAGAIILDSDQIEYIETKNGNIQGWAWDEDGKILEFYNGLYTNKLVNIQKSSIDKEFEKMQNFLSDLINNEFPNYDISSSNKVKLIEFISSRLPKVSTIKFHIFTNGTSNESTKILEPKKINDININFKVNDIRTLFDLYQNKGESIINIDFQDFYSKYNKVIPVMEIPKISDEIKGFLALIPASILVDIYELNSSQIMQQNVRSFLSARGKVNQGIRDSISNTPEKFVAYNNGITVTASAIEIGKINGENCLLKLKDFKIVNGGQTTVSLFNNRRNNKFEKEKNLEKIYLQMKILDINTKDQKEYDSNVKNISKFSNTQNPVSAADFESNDTFHVKLEKLSKNTLFSYNDSYWFYERTRGAYETNLLLLTKESEKNKFARRYPKKYEKKFGRKIDFMNQVLDKTIVSVFEMSYSLYPEFASKGGAFCFSKYMEQIRKEGINEPDELYYRNIISKAIIFQRLEKIVTQNHGTSFRRQIVIYTLSLLSFLTGKNLDLNFIQRNGNFPKEVINEEEIDKDKFRFSGYVPDLVGYVRNFLLETTGDRIITQWTKDPNCWDKLKKDVKKSKYNNFPEILTSKVDKSVVKVSKQGFIKKLSDDELNTISKCVEKGFEYWQNLASWANKNKTRLDGWKINLAYDIGKNILSNKPVTIKMAIQGLKIIEEAERQGFINE